MIAVFSAAALLAAKAAAGVAKALIATAPFNIVRRSIVILVMSSSIVRSMCHALVFLRSVGLAAIQLSARACDGTVLRAAAVRLRSRAVMSYGRSSVLIARRSSIAR